ncbi:MAG TPA: hypothetical protein VK427_09910, partial [Kofleriaceae bacterium]|nr:hypothetical protein [Kofleriaceae bacterium]
MRTLALLVAVAAIGCGTRPNPDFCDENADCEEPLGFCDVNGDFAKANRCIAPPKDCPAATCGCEPGTATCKGDELLVCNDDGMSTASVTCAMGCSADQGRCLVFEPTNGLAAGLAVAAAEPDVALPAGTQIDTTTGIVRDAQGVTIPVRTMMLPGSPAIRVLVARTFSLNSIKVTGTHALAFVAAGRIGINGKIEARALRERGGPGATVAGSCVGVSTLETDEVGAGGGGNATTGGAGGGVSTQGRAGGANQLSFSPLTGGCAGGNAVTAQGQPIAYGGGGGGALQFVSATEILVASTGVVDAGAGGGRARTGGGSGGNIVMEAPSIVVAGGIVANGGAGGGKTTSSADASSSGEPAVSTDYGGAGGTGSSPAEAGWNC